MVGGVGGVEGGSRLVMAMVKKVEMGWWSFFNFEFLTVDICENCRAVWCLSSDGGQLYTPG